MTVPDSKVGKRDEAPDRQLPEILRLLLGLGIDYFRWVLLTPMVVVWGFYLFVIVVMVYVNFEGSVWSLAESGYESYRDRFGPVAWIEEGPEAERLDEQPPAVAENQNGQGQESTDFTDDLMAGIMKGWGILALAAWGLSMLRSAVFGPRPPRTLGNKLKWTFLAAVAGWVLLFVAYFFGVSNYEGSFAGWFALYTGSAGIVIAVSALILAAATMLDMLRDYVVTGKTGLEERTISATEP